jgi:cytochrome P450
MSSFVVHAALEHGPAFSVLATNGPWAGRRVAYLVGPEANHLVLVERRASFSQEHGWRPVLGDRLGRGLVNMDPPDAAHFRTVLQPAFRRERVARYGPFIRSVVAHRTRSWRPGAHVDLVSTTREIAFDVAAYTVLGLSPGPRVDALRDLVHRVAHEPSGVRASSGAGPELTERLLETVHQRRSRPRAGSRAALDFLLSARNPDSSPMSDADLLGHLRLLLVAGYETTTNLGAWVLHLLAAFPEHGAAVDRELAEANDAPSRGEHGPGGLPLLHAAVREAGRLHPPVMFLPRVTLDDVYFNGCVIPAGTAVFLAVGAGHRLPTVYRDPDRFRPERFVESRAGGQNAYTLFGGGGRTCLGAALAQSEVCALVAHVRRHHPVTTPPESDIDQFDTVVQWLPKGIPAQVVATQNANRHPRPRPPSHS